MLGAAVIVAQLAIGTAAGPLREPPRFAHEPDVGSSPAAAVPESADLWFAEDKAKHFFLSFAVTMLSYGALRVAGIDGAAALAASGGASAAAGVWKEFRDQRLTGRFSGKDLVWDTAGTLVGLGVADMTR